jgi:NAD(P)-dependent dehydrogenase (short-subunit alcohol dehydrogenase family)
MIASVPERACGAALVTGGRRGIGRGIAMALARAGFDIAVNAEADAPDLHETVAEIGALGRRAVAVVADVADLAAHGAMLDGAEAALGPLTTLVNNAGVGVLSRGDPLDATAESFDRCLAINTRAVFFLTQAFGRRLLARPRDPARHHCVINVTSSNAVAVAMNRAEYAVSKAAASMATRCFAVRLGGEGVNVYEIQPGVIATDMTAPALQTYRGRIAAGLTVTPRVGTAEDVGAVAAAMASGAMAYCTGQAVAVDGGLLIPRF